MMKWKVTEVLDRLQKFILKFCCFLQSLIVLQSVISLNQWLVACNIDIVSMSANLFSYIRLFQLSFPGLFLSFLPSPRV